MTETFFTGHVQLNVEKKFVLLKHRTENTKSTSFLHFQKINTLTQRTQLLLKQKKIKENIKQLASTSNVEKPIQIFHAAISGTTKTISSHITKESAKQIVKRQRRINLNQNVPETYSWMEL